MPQRCYVFISGIPESVDSKRLLRILRSETNEVMRLEVLPSGKFGLALYANVPAALAAVQATVTVDGAPLVLRAMKNEAGQEESIYHPTLNVEGAEIPKTALSPTMGLYSAYRGTAAKLCQRTRDGQDCELGTSCRYIHLAEHQVTTKRKREVFTGITPMELTELFAEKLGNFFASSVLAPMKFLRLSEEEIIALRPTSQSAPSTLLAQIRAGMKNLAEANGCEKFFVKLNLPHSAPTDAILCSMAWRDRLAKACPIPVGRLPTNVKRDRYLNQVLRFVNESTAVSTPEEAVDLLKNSPRIQNAIQHWKGIVGSPGISIVLLPWFPIPSVLHEARVYFLAGNVYCATQRQADIMPDEPLLPEGFLEASASRAVRETVGLLALQLQKRRANREIPEEKDTFCVDLLVVEGGQRCVVISAHDFESYAAADSLFPQERPADPVQPRWRRRKYSQTLHLPSELMRVVMHSPSS